MVGISLFGDEARGGSTFQSDRLLGTKTGLVNEVRFDESQRGPERTVFGTAETASMVRTLPQDLEADTDFASLGAGQTTDRARLSTLGEFAERYCAHWGPSADEQAVTATYSELDGSPKEPIPFEYLRRYAGDQLRELEQSPFTPETEVTWVAGRHLCSRETLYAPAELVYVREEKRHFYSNSSGLACGETLSDAIVGGIYEAVERDAFMRTWFLGETPAQLATDSIPELAAYGEALADTDAEVRLLRLDAPGDFHAVGAAYVSDGDAMPKFVLSADAHLSLRSAIEGALLELAQTLDSIESGLASRDEAALSKVKRHLRHERSTLELGENITYYVFPDHFDEVSGLFAGDVETPTAPERSFETPRAELRACLDGFGDRDVSPLAFDVTTRDVHELGWSVVSMVLPELVPYSRPDVPPIRHPGLAGSDLRDACHPLG